MILKRNLIIHRKILQIFLMLFVFFPPMSLNHLIDTSGLWRGVNYLYKVGQLVFAGLGVFFWIISRTREQSKWFALLVAHMGLMILVCLPNGSMTIDVLQRKFLELGFCFLCAELYRKNRSDFIKAALGVFAVYTLWGVATIYLFPRGFNHASSTYRALYGLGAKNNSFPHFFAFFFFLFLYSAGQGKRLQRKIPVLIIVVMAAGLICESINTVLCIGLVLVLYYLVTKFRPVFLRLSPRILFISFVTIITLVYLGTQLQVVELMLAYFNRSTTFSGRTVLWGQAFSDMLSKPLFGAGYDTVFTLLGGTVSSHAHSQWLDKMAKFGIVQAIPLFMMLYYTFVKAGKHPDRLKGNMIAVLLLIYMLHMSFDTYNYNFFTLFVIVVNEMLVSAGGQAKRLDRSIAAAKVHRPAQS